VNIVLVGYRGTGKSSVAGVLASQLRLRAISLDAEIERRAGKNIPELVRDIGWPGFRDVEEQVVSTAAAGDGQVIDCGGGVVEREANFARLRSAGPVFWLRAQPATIIERIRGDDQRPSLTGGKSFTDEVEEVLRRRTPLYERLAHSCVDTDRLTIAGVAERIRELLATMPPS
jgi:shikimate kinase